MKELLFLCHRLPYPPDKGDKIRSYHLLGYFAKHYRVHLGTFVDDPADWEQVAAVKALCVDTCIRGLNPRLARLHALGAFVSAKPLTVAYYRDRAMQRWVRRKVSSGKLGVALAFSSGMAPYLEQAHGLRRVMDFVDVDSDKWRQYAATRRGIARAIFRREARCLAAYERQIATQADASILVSEAEAQFFRREAPALAHKVHGISNGVDPEYWNPERPYPDPYGPAVRALVFAGAMDYWANVHAARWFASEVWPRIRARVPQARFYVVGSRPAAAVLALAAQAGIVVTGRVDDVRPYLAHAYAAVTPLRIARGIQNKVLEALAMAKVLLATPEAYEGIEDFPGREGCVSSSAAALGDAAVRALAPPQPEFVRAARNHVVGRYGWPRLLAAYDAVLTGSESEPQARAELVRPVAAQASP